MDHEEVRRLIASSRSAQERAKLKMLYYSIMYGTARQEVHRGAGEAGHRGTTVTGHFSSREHGLDPERRIDRQRRAERLLRASAGAGPLFPGRLEEIQGAVIAAYSEMRD